MGAGIPECGLGAAVLIVMTHFQISQLERGRNYERLKCGVKSNLISAAVSKTHPRSRGVRTGAVIAAVKHINPSKTTTR